MATAGYPIKVYAKSSSSAPSGGDEVKGLNDATYDELADLFEITSFMSGSASPWKVRLTGLNDGAVELAGDFEAADAPQALLRSSKRSGASVWMSIYFNPSAGVGVFKGYQVECKVEKFTVKDAVGGKTEFTTSLKFNAAPTDITG